MAALDSFLNPRSVAVVGASPDLAKLRGRLTRAVGHSGYAGAIHLINPSHRAIEGRPCHARIGDVPAPVDLALIVVPAEQVLGAVQSCADAGVRNAVVLSSGFAEEGGAMADAQDRLAAIAQRAGMRLCGPNAEGFHNEVQRLSATFSPAVELDPATLFTVTERRVGVIAQSGGIGFALYHRGRLMGLSFSQVVTTGNEAGLTAADFLDHMVEDPDTAAILLFVETIRDPGKFVAAALRAAEKLKPIVAVKVGRSQAGARATASHTGAMAGWDAAYDAMFRRCGVIVSRDLDFALASIATLVTCPAPRGNRVGVLTVSGGTGALVADAMIAAGLTLPVLGAETQALIRGMIPSYGSPQNPVDVTGQATRTGAPLKVIEALETGDEVDIIVAATTMSNPHRAPVDPEGLRRLVTAQRKPILFFTYTIASEFGRRGLASAGAMTHEALAPLAAAIRDLAEHGASRPPPLVAPPALPPAARDGLDRLRGTAAEHETKALLEAAGIALPPRVLVRDATELAAAAARLGFPLAAKVQSRAIPHKTEIGGVVLHIADEAALGQAHRRILDAARRHAPAAALDGVLLERMAAPGVEVVLGVLRDPTFGPMLSIGAGGVMAELLRDVVHSLAPVEEAEAMALLRRLRLFPLLDGFRGAARADLPALARLAAQISQVAAAAGPRLPEIELNPVIVHPEGQGCTVVDALAVAAEAP